MVWLKPLPGTGPNFRLTYVVVFCMIGPIHETNRGNPSSAALRRADTGGGSIDALGLPTDRHSGGGRVD
jgi:hypothetical protein